VMLRGAEVLGYGADALDELAAQLKDHNYRIFAESGQIHAVSAGQHLSDTDPFRLFEAVQSQAQRPVDAAHAFYLGFEMAKAATALTLGKEYRQDEALDWGLLTETEQFHRLARSSRAAISPADAARLTETPSPAADSSGAVT